MNKESFGLCMHYFAKHRLYSTILTAPCYVMCLHNTLSCCRPLINVCDRFDMVGDLTHYLYSNNMLRYIEGYVQKVNPGKAPQVVGALLDSEASDEFVNNLILSVRSLIPVEQLCAEVEQRNRSANFTASPISALALASPCLHDMGINVSPCCSFMQAIPLRILEYIPQWLFQLLTCMVR